MQLGLVLNEIDVPPLALEPVVHALTCSLAIGASQASGLAGDSKSMRCRVVSSSTFSTLHGSRNPSALVNSASMPTPILQSSLATQNTAPWICGQLGLAELPTSPTGLYYDGF